jgi:hypothetical protein
MKWFKSDSNESKQHEEEQGKQEPKGEEQESDEQKMSLEDAARKLGFDIPEEGKIVEKSAVSFGITPEGLDGGAQLALMMQKAWLGARGAGAPLDFLEKMAVTLLGGIALSLAQALVETTDENPLELITAMMDLETDEQAERASELCALASEHLTRYAQHAAEQEKRSSSPSDGPPLIKPDQAEELRRMFETAKEEDDVE